MGERHSFLKRLNLALRGRWGELYGPGQQPFQEIPLPEMVKTVCLLKDDFWYIDYAFQREPLCRLISDDDKKTISKAAQKCGEETAAKISKEYGSINILNLTKKMKISITHIKGSSKSGHVYFSEYVEPDEINIYEDGLAKLSSIAEEEFPGCEAFAKDAESVLLAHELFHFFEFKEKETIYTRTYCHSLPPVFFIPRRANLICLSEIAAMAFAKRYLQLDYSPYIFDLVLTYCCNRNTAFGLYQNILSLSSRRNNLIRGD
jgi:hypothetical protein